MKYDWKFKLDCVLKYKEGRRDLTPKGKLRHTFLNQVRTWVKMYDGLGIDGLKHHPVNKVWAAEEKFSLVAKVLAGRSVKSVAKDAYINEGQLHLWVKRYREKGADGLECMRKGRPPKEGSSLETMPKKKIKLTPTEKEELKLLRERNKYLEAENLYLKKLRALELEKTAKLAKARKREPPKPSKKNPDAA